MQNNVEIIETVDEAVEKFRLINQRRIELIKKFEYVMRLWILESILQQKECCRAVPGHTGKSKEEMDLLFPGMKYQSLTNYIQFLDEMEPVKTIREAIPEEVKQKLLGNPVHIVEEKIPVYIGIASTKKKLYVFSFDEKEKIKDVFYVPQNDEILKFFCPYQQLSWTQVLRELDEIGFGSVQLDENYKFIIGLFTPHGKSQFIG